MSSATRKPSPAEIDQPTATPYGSGTAATRPAFHRSPGSLGIGRDARLQRTRPQTLGYGLADSPAGQAAWIYEKLAMWSDSDLRPEELFGRDKMLDDISLHWFTNTAAPSARLYAESYQSNS